MQEFFTSLNQVYFSYRQNICRILRSLNLGLSMEMLQIVKQLVIQDNLNQQELAELVFKDKSSLSYLLTNMERKGLVERFDDPNDKRYRRIKLTLKGRTLYTEFKSALDNFYQQTGDGILLSELEVCLKVIGEVNNALKNE